jgi:cobaltochelatase CobS subunit
MKPKEKMEMTAKLFNEIKQYFHVELEKNPDGSLKTIKLDPPPEFGPKEFFVIAENGHKQEGGKIRHAVKRFFKENYPVLYEQVEAHTKDTFYRATERTLPFVVYLMAAGKITPEKYARSILAAPHDAKVVCDQIEEKDLMQAFYDAYLYFHSHQEPANIEAPSGFKLSLPEGQSLRTLDTLLPSIGLPTFTDIFKEFNSLADLAGTATALAKQANDLEDEKNRQVSDFAKKIGELTTQLTLRPAVSVEVKASGEIPNGKVVVKDAKDIFPGLATSFSVPSWEWDGPHPDVPAIDGDYIFREDLLQSCLYAILSNQRMYIHGDTGSGKTTLVEQVAARLNWPFARINFDSEITRMDLIGRDTLKDGRTTFVDGMLPRMMSGPYMAVFDELDFVRPDVAYVMQAALEGNGLVITEDGGRRVSPHPMFRMFGTGNTVGQGDEKGMYQGARPQSLAFLDRFTIWAHVDYLNNKERKSLLQKRVPSLSKEEVTTIIKYTDEHLTAFKEAKVLQPISPRGMIAIGRTLAHLNGIYCGNKDNLAKALEMVVLHRATQSDHIVLKGLVDRVIKS